MPQLGLGTLADGHAETEQVVADAVSRYGSSTPPKLRAMRSAVGGNQVQRRAA